MSELEANGVPEGTEPTTTSQFWLGDDNKEWATSKGWDSPEKAPVLAKSARELEKAMSSRVKLPDENALPEEKQKFWEKLGWPKDGYKLSVDESLQPIRNEAIESRILEVAHKNGAPQKVVNDMIATYYQSVAEDMQKQFQDGVTKLQDELGDKYDTEVKVAQRFVKNCSPEFQEILEKTGLGNNPTIVKEFIALGRKTLSDSLIKGELVNPDAQNYKPAYPDSPEMYRFGEDADSVKAREYFTRRGFKF